MLLHRDTKATIDMPDMCLTAKLAKDAKKNPLRTLRLGGLFLKNNKLISNSDSAFLCLGKLSTNLF